MTDNIYEPTKFVGYYRLGGLEVNLKKKPCWFKRTMMRICLGWVWEDRLAEKNNDR